MAEDQEKNFFKPCDVARIAKNCVEDTDTTELELLSCVAKYLGINWLAVRFDVVSDALDVIDSFKGSETNQEYSITEFVDEKQYGKLKIKKYGKLFRGIGGILGRVVAIAGQILGFFGFDLSGIGSVLLDVIADIEVVNINRISKDDKTKDKEKKELCDCDPTGKGNGWENQERDEKGRFV